MSIVVSSDYILGSNGGRKLVRLSDGTLVSVMFANDMGSYNYLFYYKSVDNGNTWTYFKATNIPLSLAYNDVSIVSDGLDIHTICSNGSTSVWYLKNNINSTSTVTSNWIDSGQSALGNVSLAIDPSNGHLHACWSSKNSSYPNSFNIRYSKSTDGGVTWSAVEQVTKGNSSFASASKPSIVLNSGKVVILAKFNGAFGIPIKTYYNHTGVWTEVMLANGGYDSPSAVVDKDGVIHVVWVDMLSADSKKLCYSKSTDGGISWSGVTTNTAISAGSPSITVDKNNAVWIIEGTETGNIRYNRVINGSFTDLSIPFSGGNPSTLYDPYFAGEFGDTPPVIYQTANAVEYTGTYLTNQAPTLTLKDLNNQPITNSQTIKHTNKTPFLFRVLANDQDTNDNLEYRIVLRNVEYRAWTNIGKGVETEVSIPSEDLLLGNNTVDVFVRDGNGGEVSSSFILRNLTPESYSQKHVYDLIVGYM